MAMMKRTYIKVLNTDAVYSTSDVFFFTDGIEVRPEHELFFVPNGGWEYIECPIESFGETYKSWSSKKYQVA